MSAPVDRYVLPEVSFLLALKVCPVKDEVQRLRELYPNVDRHARPVTYYPELPDDYPRN